MVPPAVADIVAQAQDLFGLYWDRQNFGDHPSEDELVAHFVIQFLRALEQAEGYVESLGVPRDIIVTDGIRYRMYAYENGFAPVA